MEELFRFSVVRPVVRSYTEKVLVPDRLRPDRQASLFREELHCIVQEFVSSGTARSRSIPCPFGHSSRAIVMSVLSTLTTSNASMPRVQTRALTP